MTIRRTELISPELECALLANSFLASCHDFEQGRRIQPFTDTERALSNCRMFFEQMFEAEKKSRNLIVIDREEAKYFKLFTDICGMLCRERGLDYDPQAFLRAVHGKIGALLDGERIPQPELDELKDFFSRLRDWAMASSSPKIESVRFSE